jgi:hypothetical protein
MDILETRDNIGQAIHNTTHRKLKPWATWTQPFFFFTTFGLKIKQMRHLMSFYGVDMETKTENSDLGVILLPNIVFCCMTKVFDRYNPQLRSRYYDYGGRFDKIRMR